MRFNVNLLCILGIAIGFVALLSIWRFELDVTPHRIYDWPNSRFETGVVLLSDSIGRLGSQEMSLFYIGVMLAGLGVIAGFVTPLGGALEMVGATLFLIVTPAEEFVGGLHGWWYYLRIGPFIALFSGALMIMGMMLPVAFRGRPYLRGLRLNLWTFTVLRHVPDDRVTEHGARGADLMSWMPMRSARVRLVTAVALSAVALAASIGLSLYDSYTEPSAKIGILVVVDSSDSISFSMSVDGKVTTVGATTDILRNYFVEAGSHSVSFDLNYPFSEAVDLDLCLLPLQTEVVTLTVTDTTLTVS